MMITPRNPSFKAYSNFPEELLKGVEELFRSHFSEQNTEGDFFAFGQVHSGEMVLRVGYLKTGSLRQINFDTSTLSEKASEALNDMDHMLEATKELFVRHFREAKSSKEGFEGFSPTWAPFQGTAKEVFYKQDFTNTQLEEEANRLLGEDLNEPDNLVIGEMEDQEHIENILSSLQKKDRPPT